MEGGEEKIERALDLSKQPNLPSNLSHITLTVDMIKLNKFTGRDQVPNVFKNRSYLTKVTNLCLHWFDDNLVTTFNQIRRKPAFNATLIPSLSAIAATRGEQKNRVPGPG